MAEQSFLAILIFQDRKLKYVNEMMAKLTEYSIEELLSWEYNSIFDTIHPEDKTTVIKFIEDAIKGSIKEPIISTYRIVTKSGKIKWVEAFSKTIKYEGQIAIFSSLLDITYKKEVEQELKESRGKYQDAYAKSEFLKDVFAHDINNILQNILSSSEILSLYINEPNKKVESKNMLKIIGDQVKRGADLVLNVQKLSKMDQYKASLIPIEVLRVLKEAVDNITQNLEEKTYEIQIDSSEERFYVNGNELLIDVFENLILNAIKHNINPVKKIDIIIKREEKDSKKIIKIEFKDNGIGIEDSWKSRVFLRGFGADSIRKGMGMGLYLAKKIIDQYGGQIWVEDNIRGDHYKGSNFIIEIQEADI